MKLVPVLGHPELIASFCRLPHDIYAGDDKKTAMKEQQCQMLLTMKIPFEKEAFLLQNAKNENVGRVLFHASADPKTGHWSFLCLPEHLTNASEKAEFSKLMDQWFKTRGMSKVVGPYYFTTYFPYRMRIDEDPVSYNWEPKQPHHEYLSMKSLGHEIHELYTTNFLTGFGQFNQKGKDEYERLLKEGYTFREIDRTHLDQEIKVLYELSMKGFTDNYLFAPIPLELFQMIYVPSFKDADLRLSCVQYSPEGKPAGFNFTFHQGDQVVIKSACVLPEFRGKGLFNAGIYHGIKRTLELQPQVKHVITALVHDQNAASKHVADRSGNTTRHIYALLQKDL